MGEKEPPLQLLLERYQKTDRALGRIAEIVPTLNRRIEDVTGLSGEAYIERIRRTGRVKKALLEKAQPTLLSRKKDLEAGIRSRIESLEGEVLEIGQLVERGYLPETAFGRSKQILADFRCDFGVQEDTEPLSEETVFTAPAAVQPEPSSQQANTAQLPEWVLEAVSNEGHLIFNGRDLTSCFECAPVSLRAMRVFVQTSKERPVARSVLARTVYPDAPNLKVVLLRLSVLLSNSFNPRLYKLGLNSMSIFPQEGNQTGEVHYYLEERSADGQSEEEVRPAAESFLGDEDVTVFEVIAVPPPPAKATVIEQSEFEFFPDQELFLVACALKSGAFIRSTRGGLSRREREGLERIVEEKQEQVEIRADDLDGLILQTASQLPIYQARIGEMIDRFGRDDDRVFVLTVLFKQLHHGKKPEDLFLEIINKTGPGQARREEETAAASREDFTDEQERVAYGLFAIHPERTRFLSFAEIIKDAYANSLRGITDENEVRRRIGVLRRDFEKVQTAVIEQLRRVKLNSSDVPPRVAKLLSWLKEQLEYRDVVLDDLILVAQREILFEGFLKKAGLRNVAFSGTAS